MVPVVLFPPATLSTSQFRPVFWLPETVALKSTVPPVATDADVGLMVTETALPLVTVMLTPALKTLPLESHVCTRTL